MNPHNITKYIRDYTSDYYCKDHNKTYSTKKLLKVDHPDLKKHIVIIQIVRSDPKDAECSVCGLSLSSQGFKIKHEYMVHGIPRPTREQLLETAP